MLRVSILCIFLQFTRTINSQFSWLGRKFLETYVSFPAEFKNRSLNLFLFFFFLQNLYLELEMSLKNAYNI